MKVSKTGYKKNSKDKNQPSLLIPSNRITMKDVEFPVLGISDTGDVRIMSPGEEHIFNGNYVYELPVKKGGGHIVPGRYRNPEGNWLSKYQKGGFHQKIYTDPVEEDLRKQGAKNIPAPDFRHGGWLDKYQGDTEGSQYEQRDPNQLMYPTPGEEDTYTSRYSLPPVEITPNWTEAELERNKIRDKYIADDKKVWRHWYDKLGYDKNNVTKRANQYAYNKLAKDYLKGDKDQLTPEQRKFIERSEYASRLQPSVGSRFVEGVTNPGFNLETVTNILAPFEYPGNLVRGAVKGEFVDAVKGQTPSPYFVSSDLAGTSPTEAAIVSGLMTAGTDPLTFTGEEIFRGVGQGAKAATKPIKNAYNTVATGESFLPVAWKSPAVGLTQSASDDMFRSLANSGKLTPEERALVLEYQHGSREFTGRGLHKVNQEKRQALNNIINKYKTEIGDDVVLTRMFNDKPDALGATLENGRLNFGDRPTSFTAGVQPPGYGTSRNRLVIPKRYSKQMGDKFLVNQYDKPSEDILRHLDDETKDWASWLGTNANVEQERELIGTGLDFRKIGKVKNDIGGYDLIVKPNNPKTPGIKWKKPRSNEEDFMSLDAPKGNMYGENQVLVQQSRLLNPATKSKFFEHQAPAVEVTPGKFQKTPKDYGNRMTPENYEDFVKKIHGSTDYDLASAVDKKPTNLGIGSYGKPGMVFKDAPLSNLGKDVINAHEKNHGIFAGTLSREMEEALLKPFGTNKPIPNYQTRHQADEVLSRMGQFKNALGMGDDQIFTLGHLNLIRKNYANSFIDNGITAMLSKIKPGSKGEKEFLRNMNKYAFGIGALTAAGTTAALQKEKYGGSTKWLDKYQGDTQSSQVQKTGGVRKYQTAGPVKTVESYRSPWWDPNDPTKWNKAWTIDPERQRTQAEFPNGYTLPTIEITGEKLKNFETSNKKISTDPTYIFPPADRSEAKYDEFMDEMYNTKFNNINFGKDTIINITNTPMGWFGFNTIPGETYTSILGNNYIEKADNNTGKPEDTAGNWKTRIKDPNDTFRNADGAKHSGSYYHSKDIPAFYGIEDKKFKVGKPEDFNENTIIVPIRNSTVPYAKVDIEDGLFNRDQLYTYDANKNEKQWNLSKKDKFLVHSPATGQTIFLSNSGKKESGKFMKTALEKFKEDNPGAYIISIDEGRFGPNLHSSEGLPENAFKYWNKLNDRSSRPILYPFIVGDKTDEYYPIDSDSNPNDYGYNIGILKQKTGGPTKWLDKYEKGGVNSQGMGYFDYINGYEGVSS